jgi:hypothetical protein
MHKSNSLAQKLGFCEDTLTLPHHKALVVFVLFEKPSISPGLIAFGTYNPTEGDCRFKLCLRITEYSL